MEQITKLCNTIENNTNINDKLSQINELSKLVDIEKNTLNKLLETIKMNNIDDYKIPTKYKKIGIESLEEEFNNTDDIETKIILYYTICKKVNMITLSWDE